jgi:hypothetical protein
MKRLLIVIPSLLAMSAANADISSFEASMPRVDISKKNCTEVQSRLQSERTAILWWHSKTGLPRYGKYVSNDAACKYQQFWFRASVGTSDMKFPHACPVMQCNTYGRSANH